MNISLIYIYRGDNQRKQGISEQDGDKKSQEETRGAIYICIYHIYMPKKQLLGAIEPSEAYRSNKGTFSYIKSLSGGVGRLKPIYACINTIGSCLGA